MTGWLVPSTGQKIPVQPGCYLPQQKILLAENMFRQAGNGAEKTKEKSRQCFTRENQLSSLGEYAITASGSNLEEVLREQGLQL